MTAPAALAAVLVGVAACATTPPSNAPLRLVDAHTHLMVETLTADAEVTMLKEAGLDRVVLMSPEPDLVAAVAKRHPDFVIPSAGLARLQVKGLHMDGSTAQVFDKAYREGAVCSFGEIPSDYFGDNANVRALMAAAATTGAPLNWHIDLATPELVAQLEAALSANPKMDLVLAHLGWTAGPELIGGLLDRHRNLYTDLSIRFDPPRPPGARANGPDLSILTPDGAIQPAWRAVMERHPDRFVFAMDITSFGPRYTRTKELVATARAALAPLPRPLREAIGSGNIERLLRGCPAQRAVR